VHYTTSCKHSLVLLRMGEIIARNMLSWLELSINRYCCIWLVVYIILLVMHGQKIIKYIYGCFLTALYQHLRHIFALTISPCAIRWFPSIPKCPLLTVQPKYFVCNIFHLSLFYTVFPHAVFKPQKGLDSGPPTLRLPPGIHQTLSFLTVSSPILQTYPTYEMFHMFYPAWLVVLLTCGLP